MTLKTMETFWNIWSQNWYRKATIKENGTETSVAVYCTVKQGYAKILLARYNKMKDIIKQNYFGNKQKYISRYKRAAILAYVISSADPLIYLTPLEEGMDPRLLKQRLAFHVAIGSIILDFNEEEVRALQEHGDLFDFKNLGFLDQDDKTTERDDFLLSVYKDLFFAEMYENYNVLTMANVFGLLTERASLLATIKPKVQPH